MKYGVTKSLTADFTYNTDFAQVEADEVQVNLTRFNLSFPEKRDFFLEGQRARSRLRRRRRRRPTSGDAPTIFYSRRIGLSADRPVPIIGGGRLTGKPGRGASARSTSRATTIRRRGGADQLHACCGCGATCCAAAPSARCSRGDRSRPWRRARTRSPASTATSRSIQNVYAQRLSSPSRGPKGLRRRRSQLSRRSSTTPPTATASSSIAWSSRRTSTRRSASCGARTSGATSRPRASARARPTTASIRKYTYEGSFDYTTDNDNHLESREAARRLPDRAAEQRRGPRRVFAGLRVPAPTPFSGRRQASASRSAATTSDTCALAYSAGQQHRVCGHRRRSTSAASTTATRRRRRSRAACRRHAAARHRAEHLAQLDRPAAGSFTDTVRRQPDDLHDDAADVRRRARAVQLEHLVALDRTSGSGGSTSRAASCSSSTPKGATPSFPGGSVSRRAASS